MPPNLFIIFPNHLYAEFPTLPPYTTPVLIEEPVFFYDPHYRPFHTHQLRIAFMRATMRHYHKHSMPPNSLYIDCHKANAFYKQHKRSQITMLYPHDKTVLHKYTQLFPSLQVMEDANHFVLSLKEVHTAFKPTSHLTAIFSHVKSKLKILPNTPSQDLHNRLPLSPFKIPPSAASAGRATFHRPSVHHSCEEAIAYTRKHFSSHPGIPQDLPQLPITHEEAAQHLDAFIKHRLRDFGPYQDAIAKDHTVLYHSNLSFLINCGLLTPHQVVKKVMQHHKKHPVPINSLEGFVRQLVGWREYMRYIYERFYDDLEPLFGRVPYPKLPATWYKGTTNILPLDQEIKKLDSTAWAHHIVRLMVFLNLAKLTDFHPAAIYRWFMEMVSLDAYEWVMYSNIAAMGMYDERFMSKPYLSASAYMLKMSDYPNQKEWTKRWDAMFYLYLKKHKQELKSGKGAIYLRNLAYLEKQTPARQREILNPTT